ncbi:unnamed protein product [Polarella glacialis]|uniref:Uncharacterized protein n=1 Tax=Polarella glacialis TaxID=89957 RepID=A0A813DI22_POLGL|nr:unnamed protein product [Polarella glacialis]
MADSAAKADAVPANAEVAPAKEMPASAQVTTASAQAVMASIGFWMSDAGQCHIFEDTITCQLTYEELLGDGSERLHGRLKAVPAEEGAGDSTNWQAELMILEEDEGPWYGPSCGEKPDVVGEIKVTLRELSKGVLQLETRVKTEDDKDWAAPVLFSPVKED